MMLGLLIYSYATGVFSSRQIQRTTHDNVAVRMLCANHHPDHDTICTFRRTQRALLEKSFAQVIELAAGCDVLKVGNITVAVDGTKILSNASKNSSVSYGYAGAQMEQLKLEISQLLEKAEQVDSVPLQDGLTIPSEIQRRADRIQKLAQAQAGLEARNCVKLAEHERQMALRKTQIAAGRKPAKGAPTKPKPEPKAKAQYNLTEPESRIMKTGNSFNQAYNAQAAVEIESRLIVAAPVTNAECDKQQLLATVSAIVPEAGPIKTVLADSGFFCETRIRQIEGTDIGQSPTGVTVLSNLRRQPHGRTIAQIEKRPDPPSPPPEAAFTEHMSHRVATQAGRALYNQRQQTVEPVFGIIKGAMKFRRFSLRGLAKVQQEWRLVTLAYNVKRLFHLKVEFAA
jgi:hypothetical protein